MATKTVTLTGAEQRVDELGGLNALIVNNTDAPLYASAKAGVTPYADGVIEIKAGASRGLPDANGTVYLLGSGGRAELTGTSAGVNFNVPSQSADGGGGITRDEVNDIVTDKIAEVVANAPEDFDTLREIADWIDGHEDSAAAMNSSIKANAADISDIQTEQQTQNSSISALQTEMEQKADLSSVSNPNLLINPNFKINQQKNNSYSSDWTPSLDNWIGFGCIITPLNNGVGVSIKESAEYAGFLQSIPYDEQLIGVPLSVSTVLNGQIYSGTTAVDTSGIESVAIVIDGASGQRITLTYDKTFNCITLQFYLIASFSREQTIEWVKLELGDHATPFVPPNPMEEILKCGPIENPEQKLLYGNAVWRDAPSNCNLLDNPDFKINQRNQTEYTGSSGYCVDRWFRNAGVNVTTTSEGLSFSYVDYTNPTIYQKIPNTKELLGKTLTFSACIEGKIYKCTATLPDTQTSITYLSYARIDGEDVTPTTSDPHIRMQLHTNMGLLLVLSTLSNIQYTKLELGDKATPFISPHPALELLKCQRYLKKLNEFEVFRAAFVHTDYIDFSIPTSVTMPGAVSVLGMPWIYPFPLQLPIVDGFVFTVPVQGQSALRVRAYKTNHGLNDATLMTPDDKMVLLSAEL